MATTITREQLLEKAKPRYQEVEVAGLGVVGIRSTSILRQSHRASLMFDENGKIIQDQWNKRQAYTIVDQVMVDEKTPMFKAEDVDLVADLDPAILQSLVEAVNRFNGDEVAGKKEESKS